MTLTKGVPAVMTWSGRSARAATGTHIVEFELEDGTSEFSFHRGQLDRFSKMKADKYCADLDKWIATQKDKDDPLCFTDDTIQFGARSTLLRTVGAEEKLRPVVNAHVRKYRANIARRYGVRDNWFAPVAYVRSLPEENLVGIGPSVFLITEPLHLDRFLSNWRECGLELSDYEVPIIVSDEEFDQFAREIFGETREFLIDPLFARSDVLTLVNGTRLVSLANLDPSTSSEQSHL